MHPDQTPLGFESMWPLKLSSHASSPSSSSPSSSSLFSSSFSSSFSLASLMGHRGGFNETQIMNQLNYVFFNFN